MHTQDIIDPYSDIAQVYLQEGRVKEIIFSRETYHIQVLDRSTGDPTWAFIQFDHHQHVKDCFCSCQVEAAPTCEHLATALLKVYDGHAEPLHLRYLNSFWKHLAFAFAKKYGYDSSILALKDEVYTLMDERKQMCQLKPKTEEAKFALDQMIQKRSKETEETSLKFSNLPKKELELWQQGRPSDHFRFELSFWSDLSKWLLLMQESEPDFKVKFSTYEKIPSKITIKFSTVEVTFRLCLETLQAVIPYLNKINSPLKVREGSSSIVDKIVYDEKNKSFEVFPLEKQETTTAQGVEIGDWLFHPQKGFSKLKEKKVYSKKEVILSHDIDEALENSTSFFKRYLSNAFIETQPISPRYLVKFDGDWNLHIDLYLFEHDDLSKPQSVFFGQWVYIEEKGFYRLHDSIFKQPSIFVPREKVSEFVHQYRLWFNNQAGFETHLATVQTQMEYTVNRHKQLIFKTKVSKQQDTSYDFGDWVYIMDQGFYTKARYSSPISNGLTVMAKDIARFIYANADDLEGVEGFFSEKCPIAKASIELKVDASLQEILLRPQHALHPEYQNKPVLFFDQFTYVAGEGFCEIPQKVLLPPGFDKPQKILPHEQASFLTLQIKKLAPFISTTDPRLTVPKQLQLELEKRSNDLIELKYSSELGKVSIQEVFESCQSGNPYYMSKAGLLQLNHPRLSWIKDLHPSQFEEGALKLRPIDIIRLEAIDASFSGLAPTLTDQLYEDVDLTLPKLSGFKTKLRPYQRVGLEWLWKLFSYNLSGILCDDMGLGKTHQAMGLIAAVKNHQVQRPHAGFKLPKKKFLVVCPTSVIFHWQDKIKEFFPKLKILTFYGLNRSLDRFQQTYDVLLTTYGILRIDQKAISKYDFSLAIYDELQVAKNHRSLTYNALKTIPAKMKLGLTGTPIENNLRELKALLDLIIPGYLPQEEQFRDYFINPIERDQDTGKMTMLNKMIEPFILRRKKEDVLKDLPSKMEEISHCEMSSDQAKLYQFILNQSKDQLLSDLQDENKAVPYVHVFALLNQLKQICNHPMSFDPEKYEGYSSGKWELFTGLLEESLESGQKVVVFSQYLNMMDLIEQHLQQNQIGYASIRGSTRDRKTQLLKFRDDPNCKVFVASLKAVGLGVDLTSASVVIHYDRWWNAARENQATDRVHRIGQKRGVQVFKLVTLNTLEESISKIISSKGKLMEDVVGTSEDNHHKLFSRQDLIDILQTVQKEVYKNS